MSTIAAFEKEIKLQVSFVKRFVSQKQLSVSQQKQAIFCGTGDSFVSALLAEVFSDFRAHAFDPLDLIKNKKLAKGKKLYLISISGNTVSNIQLARTSKNTTAVTANPQSRLAQACTNSIFLQYPNSGIFTAGSISFLASALTCISLVSKIRMQNVFKLFKKAETQSRKVQLVGKVFLLGNLHTFPVAMFGVAKLYETTGLDAHYERIEQFSHMGLFSAKREDTVIIFEEKNKYNSKLASSLKKSGLRVIQLQPNTSNIQETILFFIFVSEFIALYHAKKKNQKDCFFVTAKKLRKASSSMIY
ncbi:MAG TPA: sugar isomerase [Nitrosopumilaceae archaeon]|nr:sugar isomerase [Nitrosopumilaceae archaeon]